MAILQDQTQTHDQLLAQIAALQAQNEALRKAKVNALGFKVSDKGAVSVYGMGRFPVTLYAGQWDRLIEAMPKLKAFIEANRGLLATKGE